jgi:hypothetical protein
MFAHIIELRYWKSEHTEATCEDVSCSDSEQGLFAIADGAGTTLFSNVWARVLVEHFMNVPLLSNDPFEVEWWVRQAQSLAKQQMPQLDAPSWNAQQKLQNQGSAATLATLRFSSVNDDAAQAELLAMGDSCILIRKANSETVLSFPVDRAVDFEKSPICIPSKLTLFNRYFHRCLVLTASLQSGDTAILATDAVARWIISAGGGLYKRAGEAFDAVSAQTPDTWPAFIKACRARGEMVDDDCTALLLTLQSDASQGALQLGSTTNHRQEIREQRKRDFTQAMQEQNREFMAIYYGDGVDLALEGMHLPQEEIEQAHRVADALREVLAVVRQVLNSPDVTTQVGAAWAKHAEILSSESCAENLRQTLTQLGVISSLTSTKSNQLESQSRDGPNRLVNASSANQEPVTSPQEKDWRKLELARRFVGALRADDDEEILAAHEAIQTSPYTQAIIFTPMEMQRILEAQQRVGQERDIQDALQSKSVKRMAEAYTELSGNVSRLTKREIEQLMLAHRFLLAFEQGSDEELLAIYEDIMQSPYFTSFLFTAQEEERVAQAWYHVAALADANNTSVDLTTAPTLSTSWFNKVCNVKYYYLLYENKRQIPADQIARLALEDLVNDIYIQKGLQNIRLRSRGASLDVDKVLEKDLERFKQALTMPYPDFLSQFQLTDEEVRTILRIFLRGLLLEDYLRKNGIALSNWLELRKYSGKNQPSFDFLQQGQPFLNKGKEA